MPRTATPGTATRRSRFVIAVVLLTGLVDGTRRLIEAAHDAGVGHMLYTSIIGADRVPWGYFRTKVRAEEIVKAGGLPWSIVRAAQFHEFVDQALRLASRFGVMIADPGISAQPVDVRDVADRIRGRIGAGPSGAVEEFGGPEMLGLDEAIRDWLDVRELRRPILRIKLPGRLGTAFRGGHLVTGARPTGKITWRQYLTETYA